MTTLSTVLAPAIADGRLTATELDTLVSNGRNPDGTPSTELKQTLLRFCDALDATGVQRLDAIAAALGISVPATRSLANDPALAEVRAGSKVLSTASNRRDAGVELVQRALMRLSVQQGHARFTLPRFGADGDLGGETTGALKAFQASVGLPANGVVTATVVSKLIEALAGPPPTSAFRNGRFSGAPGLNVVLAGTALGRGANGEGVRAVQQALSDLGYAFAKSTIDGDFGADTLFCLTEFQRDNGLPISGKIDAATLRRLDQVATAPGVIAVKKPEYDKMVVNGVMSMMLSIGYDEDNSDQWVRPQVQIELAAMGFEPFEVAGKSDADLRAAGLDPTTIDKEGTYYLAKNGQVGGKPAKILLKYIDRETPHAADRFAQGFASCSMVMYGGHARYGSGPDFDPKDSMDGNFVITDPYDAHMASIIGRHGHDADRVTMTQRYQLMLFSGCKTRDYLKGLRTLREKTGANLDTITSNDLLYWDKLGTNMLITLRNVMAGADIEKIKNDLKDNNGGTTFTGDGFGGNPS